MWGVDVQRGVDVQHGVSMYNAVSMFNVSMLNVSMFNVSMFNVVSMYNVVFNVGCRCTMWHRCSMWCQFIHLRRKPQLEAQGVCKVRVSSNFQSIHAHSPVEYGTPTLSGILAAPQRFSLYVHVHSTMLTRSSYGDMAIIRRHGHSTMAVSTYNGHVIVEWPCLRGHGHCMRDMAILRGHGSSLKGIL